MKWDDADYSVDTDPARIDRAVVFAFLKESYWAGHRTRDEVDASWVNATVQFGLYAADGSMVGGCRVLSDWVTYAWLGDVFVLPEHRGRGLGKYLVSCVLKHPAVTDVEQFHLGTKDAHALYRAFGWEAPRMPERLMIRLRDGTPVDPRQSPRD